LVTLPVGTVHNGRARDLIGQLEQLRDEQIQKHARLRPALAPSSADGCHRFSRTAKAGLEDLFGC
jgi:hypothetical protein